MKGKIFKKITSFLLIISMFLLFSYIPVFALEPSSSNIYRGIDVSEWQGNIDYSQVKNAGIEVVYIRASEGFNYTDPYYLRNYNGAKENEIKVGFYHYLTARNTEEAEEQADFFASVIGGLSPDCRLAIDFESFPGLSNDEINEISFAFLRRVQEKTGKEMVVYSDAFNAREVFSQELANEYPIWIAEYFVEEPEDNGKWNSWVGFQYADDGNISGINANVDLDYYTDGIFLSDTSNLPTSDNPPPSPEETKQIIVEYGDTLSNIAVEYNTTVERLAEINNIANPNLIYVGQTLLVPTSGERKQRITYVVKRGDTLSLIANRYNTTVNELVEINNIENPNLIYVGQILIINTANFEKGTTNNILYTVRYGDTLSKIANRYNTTVSELVRINSINNPNLIYVGQVIRIRN